MDTLILYHAAHLIVAAIRIVEYREKQPPDAAAVAALLSVSTEQTLRICRKLQQHGVIKIVSGGYGEKIFIVDHLALESLSHEAPVNDITEELQKFKQKQSDRDKKIEAIKQQEEERKKNLFALIEQQFKEKQREPDDGLQDSLDNFSRKTNP